jgi:AcrR family transcriptional regulator
MAKNNLNPKKFPSQQRSKEKIEHILDVTIQILEDSGIEGLTTNHIAKEANISVASIYQYFPNKYAILYEIYQRWLNWVMDKLDKIEHKHFMVLDWPEFFDKLNIELLENTLYSYKAESQIFRAMQINRDLREIDKTHVKKLGKRVVKYLKGYGLTWDEGKIEKLAAFLVSMPDLVYNASDPTVEDRKLRIGWVCKMTSNLLKECFE